MTLPKASNLHGLDTRWEGFPSHVLSAKPCSVFAVAFGRLYFLGPACSLLCVSIFSWNKNEGNTVSKNMLYEFLKLQSFFLVHSHREPKRG